MHVERAAVRVRDRTGTFSKDFGVFKAPQLCGGKKSEKREEISAGEFFQVIAHFQYSQAAATVLENGGALQVWSAHATGLLTCGLTFKVSLKISLSFFFFFCSLMSFAAPEVAEISGSCSMLLVAS